MDTSWIDQLTDRYKDNLFRDPVDFLVGEGWREIVTSLCADLDTLHLRRLQITQPPGQPTPCRHDQGAMLLPGLRRGWRRRW